MKKNIIMISVITASFVALFPILYLTCEQLSGRIIGVSYVVCLSAAAAFTEIGRTFVKLLYVCTTRLERILLGSCCEAD